MSGLRRTREQRVDAYRDGALSPRARAAFERGLASDARTQAQLRRSDALGRAIREIWSEGPPAPRVDLVIQALRPQLARADAERVERASATRWISRVRDRLGPVPLAVAGAAALLALALASPGLMQDFGPQGRGESRSAVSAAGIAVPNMAPPSAIYDLSQEGAPLMVFQTADGSTVIWILENPDQQSLGALSLQEF
jgi:hypothetical protein